MIQSCALTTFFLICAVVGGTVLICQFVLTLVGLGGDHMAIRRRAHDFPGDVGHDVHVGGAWREGAGHDAAGQSRLVVAVRGDFVPHAGRGRDVFRPGRAGGPVGRAGAWACSSLLAVAAGVGAMYGVHWIVRTMGRLGEDGTVRVRHALGQEGTVYVPIPAAKAQAGKIQLKLQNRLVEYEAVTSGPERLATGTKVRVVGITGNTLEVEPLRRPARCNR